MDTFNWSTSQEGIVLTSTAQIPAAGNLGKVDWPYSVGSVDFNLFENGEGPTVQTIFPTNVPAVVNLGGHPFLDEIDSALNPLERLQRKWGIGDRKTRDGQPPKRRGPKPDSKPAWTRRQELNRQAQRYVLSIRLMSLYSQSLERIEKEKKAICESLR
jgi:hypothetical protein